MKKPFIVALAVLTAFGMSSCGLFQPKSDEAACNTLLTGMSQFKDAHKTPPKNMTNPVEALAMLQPVAKTMKKASAQAKTGELADSLRTLGDVIGKGKSASILDIAGIPRQVISIKTLCKEAGVDMSKAFK